MRENENKLENHKRYCLKFLRELIFTRETATVLEENHTRDIYLATTICSVKIVINRWKLAGMFDAVKFGLKGLPVLFIVSKHCSWNIYLQKDIGLLMSANDILFYW